MTTAERDREKKRESYECAVMIGYKQTNITFLAFPTEGSTVFLSRPNGRPVTAEIEGFIDDVVECDGKDMDV